VRERLITRLTRRKPRIAKRSTRIALIGLPAVLLLSSCDVNVGGDEGATVTEAAPTVTEREVIKQRTVESDETTVPATDEVGGNVQEAAATVANEGYEVTNPDTYDTSYPLRVLIGIRQGSATGYA
jgi:hypothetical protein